jgi:hypothetical protein
MTTKTVSTWTLDDLGTIASNIDALQARLEDLTAENAALKAQVEAHTIDIRVLNPSRAAFPVEIVKGISPADIINSVFIGGTIALASNPQLMQNARHRQDHFRRMLDYANEIVTIMADRFGVATSSAEAVEPSTEAPKKRK